MEEMEDILSFFAWIVGLFANPLGFTTAIGKGLEAVRGFGANVWAQIPDIMGKYLGRPLAKLVWSSAVVLSGLLIIAGIEQSDVADGGSFWSVILTGIVSVAVLVLWGAYQWRCGTERYALDRAGRPVMHIVIDPDPGGPPVLDPKGNPVLLPVRHKNYKPRKVSFFRSGVISAIAFLGTSVMLSRHAAQVESSFLWAVSMVMWYVGLTVVASMASVVSWFLLKVVRVVEMVTQSIVEPAVAALPIYTLKNVREMLFGGGDLHLINENLRAEQVVKGVGVLAFVSLFFHLLVLPFPGVRAVWYIGVIIFAIVGAGVLARLRGWIWKRPNVIEHVDSSLDRFVILFYDWWKWVVAAAFGWSLIGFTPPFRAALGRLSAMYEIWTARIVSGEAGVGGGHSIPGAFLIVILVSIGGYAVYEFTKGWKEGVKGKAKAVLCGAAAVTWLYSLVVLAVAFGVCGDPVHGMNPLAQDNAPETPAQTIRLVDKQGNLGEKGEDIAPEVHKPQVHQGENWLRFDWWTDKPARCVVEVLEVRMAGEKDYVHPIYKPESTWLATSEAESVESAGYRFLIHHSVTFNNLGIGQTLVLRVRATGTEGVAKGYTTVLREFNESVVAIPASVGSAAPSATPSASPPPAQTAAPNARRVQGNAPPSRVASACDNGGPCNRAEVERDFNELVKELNDP